MRAAPGRRPRLGGRRRLELHRIIDGGRVTLDGDVPMTPARRVRWDGARDHDARRRPVFDHTIGDAGRAAAAPLVAMEDPVGRAGEEAAA